MSLLAYFEGSMREEGKVLGRLGVAPVPRGGPASGGGSWVMAKGVGRGAGRGAVRSLMGSEHDQVLG